MLKHLDLILYIIIFITIVTGFIRGIIMEIFNISAVILGAAASYLFADSAALYFCIKFSQPYFLWKIVCSIAVYGIVYFCVIIISYFINKIISIAQLTFANRAAGAVFGLGKGIFIVYLILLILNCIPGFTKKTGSSKFQKIYVKLSPSIKLPDTDYIKESVLLAKKIKMTAESPEFRKKIIELAKESDETDSGILSGNLQDIINDRSFMKKVDDNDWMEVLENPQFKKIMQNENFKNKALKKE